MRLPFAARGWLPAARAPRGRAVAWGTGCTPDIGDSCALSTDCASDGTRVCDTSEPGGYCTVLNCTGNNLGSVCPDNALCVEFFPNVPGCPFSARAPLAPASPSAATPASHDSDCRGGLLLPQPEPFPWNAEILDPDQTAKDLPPAPRLHRRRDEPVGYGYDGRRTRCRRSARPQGRCSTPASLPRRRRRRCEGWRDQAQGRRQARRREGRQGGLHSRRREGRGQGRERRRGTRRG